MNDLNKSEFTLEKRNSDIDPHFFTIIKTEYLKNLLKTYFLVTTLICFYLIYQFLMSSYELSSAKYVFDPIVFWFLFILFLVVHFYSLSYNQFTPTLVDYLKNELHFLGFEMVKKYKIGLNFVLFNSFSFIFFLLLNIGMSYSLDYIITSFSIRLLLLYIFLSVTIPILRGNLHDKYIIKLKSPYYVRFDLQCKLIKHKEVESHMIRIYITSNKLYSESYESGFKIYKEISEKRWLSKRGRRVYHLPQIKKYIIFHEYSTLINFKEHLLNLISAIRDWDEYNSNQNQF